MIKVSVIGAGYWGPNLIRNFYEFGALNIMCDKDKEKLAKIGEKYPSVTTTTDVDDAIRKSDAIVIATEGDSHYELAKKSLLAGKNVFVEKPLTLHIEEGEELLNLSIEKSLVLMVGHLLLYHPGLKKLREYVLDETLGEIYYLYSQRLNLGKIKRNEDALWSFGPHDISVALYLLDKMPTKVTATASSYLQSGVPDVVFLTLHFPDKVLANIHLSWLDPHKIRKITIVGNKKMAVFDDMQPTEKIRLYDKGVDYKPSFKPYGEDLVLRIGDVTIPNISSKEPLKLECQHFMECVEKHLTPLSDGVNGVQVVRVLESAQKSLQQGGTPVEINGD